MKNKTVVSFICAVALTAGAVAGLTGFKGKETELETTQIGTTGDFQLLSTSEIDGAQVNTSGTITGVSDVAAAVMPAVVSITNKTVQEVQSLYGRYGRYGFGGGETYTYETESCGSGIIIGENDEELLICTNNHVVEGATEITVGFVDDEVYTAVVKGDRKSVV